MILWATGSIRPEQEFHQHLIPWKLCSCTCGPSGSTVSSSPSQLSSSMRRFSTTRCQMNQPHLQRRVRSRRWRVFRALCTSGTSWTRWSQPGFAQTFAFFVHLALFVICFIQLYIGPPRTALQILLYRVFVTLQLFYTAPGQGLFGFEILMWWTSPSTPSSIRPPSRPLVGGIWLGAWLESEVSMFGWWLLWNYHKLSNQSSHWYLILIWSTPPLNSHSRPSTSQWLSPTSRWKVR